MEVIREATEGQQIGSSRQLPAARSLLEHLDPRCLDWYAELDLEEHRRYLMEAYGIEYEDWYLETQVESAMKPAPPSPPIQL